MLLMYEYEGENEKNVNVSGRVCSHRPRDDTNRRLDARVD